MSDSIITNPKNSRIKEIAALSGKARLRRTSGLFVVEGLRMAVETPKELLKEIYISESFSQKNEMKGVPDDVPFFTVSDAVFSKMCDTMHPQGILTVVRQPAYDMEDILRKNTRKRAGFLVLENIQDPGNAGTMLRTAEAAGMDGVILSGNCVDIFNPKTIRSTMGSLFRMPFCHVDDSVSLIELFRSRGIKTFAATLEDSVSYTDADLAGGGAVFIGNEGSGLLAETAAKCDERIHIPMEGMTESLNAAVSAAVIMFEMKRQRLTV